MSIELRVPEVGESVSEVEIGPWLKSAGDAVTKDEPLVTLESEKATVELPCPASGVMGKQLKQQGEVAKIGEVIGYLEPAGTPPTTEAKPEPNSAKASQKSADPNAEPRIMPAAQRALEERELAAGDVTPTGPGGRILKEDVIRASEVQSYAKSSTKPTVTAATPPRDTVSVTAPELKGPVSTVPGLEPHGAFRQEEVVPMSRLRRTIAQRLVDAQQTAALLTTFNEIDMSIVMGMRKEYGELFLKKYSVKLGFMSFFVKAVVDALKQFPAVNAEVRGNAIVYRNYYDIGVAVGSGKGLVVPVLRNAERMSLAEIEQAIGDFGQRARENKLKLDELQGGTFTISNGGVYGSLLSTPIVNPPQSGVLGMHGIQDRPVARDGAVVIRPMMYVALTYDHRVVDGREAVTFLRRIKEVIEAPARMLMEV
jgi:2-oxoglutarate dehydrogenase E2 component (dihydrolipoamide succinyltransferase)